MSTNRASENAGMSAVPGGRLEAVAQALLKPLGAPGVYARTALYEDVVESLTGYLSRQREPGTEVLRFPPVMSRRQVETSGYLKSFPHLLGCVCALHGTEVEIEAAVNSYAKGEDWTAALAAGELVLTPAACYPIYPLVAARGPIPADGLRFDVAADCFRREPSNDLDRLQSFRMREFVRIGTPEQVTAFRQDWMEQGRRLASELALPHTIVTASDPFFGRTGQMLGIAQSQQSLKFELMVPLDSEAKPTACMSFNYHRDHFGATWRLLDMNGGVAHSACVAFGMDRLVFALFCHHGLDTGMWPGTVRSKLALA